EGRTLRPRGRPTRSGVLAFSAVSVGGGGDPGDRGVVGGHRGAGLGRHRRAVGEGDAGGVEDLHPALGGDLHVVEGEGGDLRLRQAPEDPGLRGAGGGQVLDGDVLPVRRRGGDGHRRVGRRIGRQRRVVRGDVDRRRDVGHCYVA